MVNVGITGLEVEDNGVSVLLDEGRNIPGKRGKKFLVMENPSMTMSFPSRVALIVISDVRTVEECISRVVLTPIKDWSELF